jgi:hypothetical protein
MEVARAMGRGMAVWELPSQEPQTLEEVFDAALEELDRQPQGSFVIQLRDLVRELLQLTLQVSERDRHEIERMKEEYHRHSETVADAFRSKGNANLAIAVVSFALQFGSLAFSNEQDQKLVQSVAGQVPNVGSFFTGKTEANQSRSSNLLALINTEYTNKTTEKSSQGNWKQELIQAMQEVLATLRKASGQS